jgi:hemin uptake protein HemP
VQPDTPGSPADSDHQVPQSPPPESGPTGVGLHAGSGSAITAIRFEELAQGASEVLIGYRGQQYRLRTTRNGGLILNK